jgi:hypothetical protein
MPQRTLKRTNARNRRALDPSVPRKLTPAVISSIDATAANTIQITFNGRVMPSRLPGFRAGAAGAMTVESMSPISATVIELVFTGTVAATNLLVQEGDAGIRTPSGGFVPAGTYAIPTFP